jgi:hypothetical protein
MALHAVDRPAGLHLPEHSLLGDLEGYAMRDDRMKDIMALWYYDHMWDYSVDLGENLRRFAAWWDETEDD